jgi:hypothetical protein
MCNYSGRLVAWMDHELPEAEAINVGWHVGRCAECRRAVRSYQEISEAFLNCCVAATPARPGPRYMRWIGVGAAAAILIATLTVHFPPETFPEPSAGIHAPAFAFEKTREWTVAVHPHRAPHPRSVPAQWTAFEPTVEVALPADALFPPGAVPAGFSFIADVHP